MFVFVQLLMAHRLYKDSLTWLIVIDLKGLENGKL